MRSSRYVYWWRMCVTGSRGACHVCYWTQWTCLLWTRGQFVSHVCLSVVSGYSDLLTYLWYASLHILSQSPNLEIGNMARRASGIKIPWGARLGLLSLSSVWLLAGLLVVIQWEAWVRGDQWGPHQIQNRRISRKCGFLSSGSLHFFRLFHPGSYLY